MKIRDKLKEEIIVAKNNLNMLTKYLRFNIQGIKGRQGS